MIRFWSISRRSRSEQRGFTIIEATVAMAVASILVVTALGGLLFGMSQARAGQNRAAAATWAEAEMSYLLIQGYSHLSAQSYTLTQTTGYHTYNTGGCSSNCIAEPTIPAGFDHATIAIATVTSGATQVAWQVTITLYQKPTTVYTTFSTYLSSYSHA